MSNWISSLIDLAGTAGQLFYHIHDRERNYAQELKSYEDYRSDIAIQREREDTAVQRHVADLKKAGLSPILAAGGQGAASHAPQQGTPAKKDPMQILGIIAAKEQISMTRAERERIKAQIANIEEDTKLKIQQAKHYGAQAIYTGTQNEYYRAVMGYRVAGEARKDRIESMLEPTTIATAKQNLQNLVLEGDGQQLRNILYQQQQTINSLQQDLMERGIKEKDIQIQRLNIQRFIEHELADVRISYESNDLLNKVLIDQALIENMEYELERGRYNLEESRKLEIRTNDQRPQQRSFSFNLGIPTVAHIQSRVQVRERADMPDHLR